MPPAIAESLKATPPHLKTMHRLYYQVAEPT